MSQNTPAFLDWFNIVESLYSSRRLDSLVVLMHLETIGTFGFGFLIFDNSPAQYVFKTQRACKGDCLPVVPTVGLISAVDRADMAVATGISYRMSHIHRIQVCPAFDMSVIHQFSVTRVNYNARLRRGGHAY